MGSAFTPIGNTKINRPVKINNITTCLTNIVRVHVHVHACIQKYFLNVDKPIHVQKQYTDSITSYLGSEAVHPQRRNRTRELSMSTLQES